MSDHPLAGFTDYHLRSLVPIKFHASSGLSTHDFRLLLPNWEPAFPEERAAGVFRCAIRQSNQVVPAIVTQRSLPRVFQALTLISGVDGETSRVERYLAIHSAHEAVVPRQDVHATAIRHALAHPAALLTKPEIVASLQRRFGGTAIALHDYYHQKEFYRSLAAMLIAIDDEVVGLLAPGRAA